MQLARDMRHPGAMRRTDRPGWIVMALAAVLMAGCNGGGGGGQPAAGGGATPTKSSKVEPVVSFVPAPGQADVPLSDPVQVSVVSGRLAAVTVSATGQPPLAGQLDPSGGRWVASAPLAPATSYKVAATVQAPDGSTNEASSTFKTLAPKDKLTARVAPLNGTVVGVGQPIAVYLTKPIADHAAVERHLTVTTEPAVAGSWHWFSDTQLHWRPQQYWATGTKVTLAAALAGVDFGAGTWGTESRNVAFTIGDAHVSVVDANTHQMTVSTNGKVEKTIPVSTGRDKYPTKSGVHVVMDKEQTTVMDSSTVGIPAGSPGAYKEKVYWNVRISNSGEFVHAAPWSVGSQGRVNVSHGCVNASVADATWFFNYSRLGDVVEVKGTPEQIEATNGFGDWNVPWPAPV